MGVIERPYLAIDSGKVDKRLISNLRPSDETKACLYNYLLLLLDLPMRSAYCLILSTLLNAIAAAPVQHDANTAHTEAIQDDVDFGALYEYLDKVQAGKPAFHHEAQDLPHQSIQNHPAHSPAQPSALEIDSPSIHHSRKRYEPSSSVSNTGSSYTPVPKRRKHKAYNHQTAREARILDLSKQRAPLHLRNGEIAEDHIPLEALYKTWTKKISTADHVRLMREVLKRLPMPRRTLASRLDKYCTFGMACDIVTGDDAKVAAAILKLNTDARHRTAELKTLMLGSRSQEIAQKIQKSTRLSETYTVHMINKLDDASIARKLLSDKDFDQGVKELREKVPWVPKRPEDKMSSPSPPRPLMIKHTPGRRLRPLMIRPPPSSGHVHFGSLSRN
jgi:hypothetical protein